MRTAWIGSLAALLWLVPAWSGTAGEADPAEEDGICDTLDDDSADDDDSASGEDWLGHLAPPPEEDGCQCRAARGAPPALGAALLGALGLAALWSATAAARRRR